jgi:general secretion pathway protein G
MIVQQRRDQKRTRGAFTLMEVLVVVAILVVLASIGIVVFRYLDDSNEKVARLGIKNIETAITAYRIAHGSYPQSLQELTMPEGGKPAYLEDQNLVDPWGRPYGYDPNQHHPKTGKPLIFSQGVNPGNQAGMIRNW